MADRVGVISKGELILVEDKRELMQKLGKKRLTLTLTEPLADIPGALAAYPLALSGDKKELVYTYDTAAERVGVTALLHDLAAANVAFKDLHTEQSSLEDIFVNLVRGAP
jgi:ABC-2 type transport system ATP-binding protein